jgi:hypothetical protein
MSLGMSTDFTHARQSTCLACVKPGFDSQPLQKGERKDTYRFSTVEYKHHCMPPLLKDPLTT